MGFDEIVSKVSMEVFLRYKSSKFINCKKFLFRLIIFLFRLFLFYFAEIMGVFGEIKVDINRFLCYNRT